MKRILASEDEVQRLDVGEDVADAKSEEADVLRRQDMNRAARAEVEGVTGIGADQS
jgi:hypothetical protein